MELYIRNLTAKHTSADLQTLFEKYGVTASKIITNKNKISIGFGFIQIADEAKGEQAIKDLNGTKYNGRIIFVRPANPSHYNHFMGVKNEVPETKKPPPVVKPTTKSRKKK